MKRDNTHLLSLILLSILLQLTSLQPLRAQSTTPDTPPIQATATRTLLNGLRIEILSAPQFPRVAIHLLVGVGTTLDPAQKAGLAELTAALIVESVPEWQGDPEEIDRIIAAGKTFQYAVDWDSTHFFAECAPQELVTYLRAAARFVERPVLTEDRFAAVRDRTLARLEQTPTSEDISRLAFDAELFQGNPYARPMTGTAPTIQNIIYGETVLFQRRYYIPNASFLALAGPVDAEAVRVEAGRALGIWIMDDEIPFTFLPPRGQSGLTLTALDWTQGQDATLSLGNLGIPRNSKDYVALQLIVRILNGPARSLYFPEFADSTLRFEADGRRLRGAIRVVLRSQDLDATQAVQGIRRGLQGFLEKGPTAEETTQAARQYLEAMVERAKTAPELARMLAEAGTYQLGFNYYERLKQELPLLTADDLRRAANSLLDADSLLAVYAGPVSGQNLDAVKEEGWVLRILIHE